MAIIVLAVILPNTCSFANECQHCASSVPADFELNFIRK